MRLGVVTTSYPRFAGDPAGSFVGAHVAALRRLGHVVEVVAAGDPRASVGGTAPDDAERVPSALFYGGGAPDALERLGVRALPGAAAFTAKLTARVVARAGRWDAVIAHWLVPSAVAALAARRPLLAIAHGGDVHTLRRAHLLGPVLRALRARGATLSVVSEELRAMCAPWIDARVQPMGIDVAHFAALGRAPTSPPTVAVIGRLVPVKGIDVAIRALGHVRTPVQLVIAGDGPDREHLARLVAGASPAPAGLVADAPPAAPAVASVAVTSEPTTAPTVTWSSHPIPRAGARDRRRVELCGELDADRRDQLLREASVVVIPSRVLPGGRSEGVPLVALEALAAGVPVVASAVGGLRDLPARIGRGIELVPPDDPRALAAAIDRVLADPPARGDVAALDWDRVAARLVP